MKIYLDDIPLPMPIIALMHAATLIVFKLILTFFERLSFKKNSTGLAKIK